MSAKAPDDRTKLATSAALGVLLRNIILNERCPLYTQGEWVTQAEPALRASNGIGQ